MNKKSRTLWRVFSLALCLLFSWTGLLRADWKAADGPLGTRWARGLTPEGVWNEHPRPQMARNQWTSLNGLWDYAVREKEADRPERWDGKILVPFCLESALSGVMKKIAPESRLWYRRAFRSPELTGDRRLLLHFGAVDWDCTVWVNGTEVGSHRGGFDPFTLDVTSTLQADDNELVVRVWDPTDAGYQPRGKQVRNPRGIWYTAVTGIWQTVWLEVVPASAIEALRITPDVDAGLVRVSVRAPAGGGVSLSASDGGKEIASATGETNKPIALELPDAKPWSPETPHLYDLTVRLLRNGKVVDEVRSYFGMRKIEVKKDEGGLNRLFLNNRPLFQYGPLDQGWWPDGLYTAPSDEALRYDIEVTKKLGFNMARKHVKVEPDRWYYWCDKLGLLVWQDMPSGNNNTDEGKRNFERELRAVVDSFYNHPSIVMWVPFNEGWGQYDTERIVSLVKKWDPTRPVNEASGWHNRQSGDVSDAHSYPGPGMRAPEDTRVSVLGEFGGLGLPVKGHTWQDEKNWGYRSFTTPAALTDAYVGLLERLRPLLSRGLAAAVYTQTTDVEIEVNGLLTYDRAVIKMDAERIAEAARKLYLPPPRLKTLVPTSQAEARTWRYTTTRPPEGWASDDFDDSSWKSGPGGFGSKGTPGAVVRTEWTSPDVWIRRSFELEDVSGDVVLLIHHDEDVEVYLNGKLAAKATGYTVDYVTMSLRAPAAELLRAGKNRIAVHCHQTGGGQYIDVGLVAVIERE